MSAAAINLILIGGDRLFREGLHRLFEASVLHVIAETDWSAGLDQVPEAGPDPDVLIAIDTDLHRPAAETGLEQFRQQWPRARTVALVTGNDDVAAMAALRLGLDGCLFTDMSPQALVQAIQLVAMGENVFPTRIGRVFANNEQQAARPHLTPREYDILDGLLAGHSNKTIANSLGTTDMTVKAQLRHLLRKLRVTNRTQAALWAREQGLEREQR